MHKTCMHHFVGCLRYNLSVFASGGNPLLQLSLLYPVTRQTFFSTTVVMQ